jgi:serine/threonine-protein kinase RsbW
MRRWLRRRARAAGFGNEATDEILLAATEACSNAIVHSGSPTVEVRWDAGDRDAVVQVLDRGRFRRRLRVPQVEGPGGYGIPLMTAVMDEVEIREGTPDRPGTTVRLLKRR